MIMSENKLINETGVLSFYKEEGEVTTEIRLTLFEENSVVVLFDTEELSKFIKNLSKEI